MGILDKIFGGGKKEGQTSDKAIQIIEETMDGIFGRANFDLSYDLTTDEEDNVVIEMFGKDEQLLTDKEGMLLNEIQLFIKRVLQHKLPDEKVNVVCDSNNFRKQANEELIKLAEKLKKIVLEKNKSVYFRALPPKDRKVIHQYLAEDGRVKSKSVGEGHFKKIKIFPVRAEKQS